MKIHRVFGALLTDDVFTITLHTGETVTCPSWEKIREMNGKKFEKAREEYNNNPVVVELREAKLLDFFDFFDNLDDFARTRDQTTASARANAFCFFAVVKDGKWYERGEMGWWGVVRNEKEKDTWAEEFAKLVDGMPPETWLTVVDCHI